MSRFLETIRALPERLVPATAVRAIASRSSDIWAGLSVAAMSIPSVMGYARIANVPPLTALYTILFPPVAFALLGSSRHLMVGADSATAAIFSNGLSLSDPAAGQHYITLVSAIALLNAALLLIARVCKLGFLADFLSRTVLVGFMAGVGVQIGVAMLGDMLSIPVKAHATLAQAFTILTHISSLGAIATAISVGTCVATYLTRRVMPMFPIALVAVSGSILLSWATGLEARGVAVIGPFVGGLPSFSIPIISWHEMLLLMPVVGSCVFVIIAQSAAASRTFADMFGEPLDENADLLGLAAANAAAGMTGTFTVNGSLTQSAFAVQAGARTQTTQIVYAAVTLCVLLFLSGPLRYLPRCVLGAIVFCVAAGMIRVQTLRDIRKESPGEFRLAIVTAATVIGIGVEQGILIAIGLSLLHHVRHSYRPHTGIVVLASDGEPEVETVHPDGEIEPGLVVYRFGADLFYANCRLFSADIHTLTRDAKVPVRCIIVDCSAITDLDYSAARLVRGVIEDCGKGGITMMFARVSPFLHADMARHGIIETVGENNIFWKMHTAKAAFHHSASL